MAHQPVGDSQTITTSATSAMVQFAVQSDTVRVVPTGQNVHVAIGTTAVATTSDYFVPAGTPATLNLGRASSMGIADITKGASTVITLSEGMGNPFKVDDVLTISGVTGVTGFNTTAKVVSVQEARTIGYAQFGAKLTVDHDSRALNSDNAVTTAAEARRTLTVAARTDTGSGKLYVQQVQISGVQ